MGILFGFSYKEFLASVKDLFAVSFEFDNHDLDSNNFIKKVQPYLLSTEFLFIVVTALISINLINIVRPFPIGWDDL